MERRVGRSLRLTSNNLRPLGWTSADAAGLPILPGLVRYDEVAAGAIRHAIRVTFSETQDGYILPATHSASDSTNPNRPPMGMRLRLSSAYDVSQLTGQGRGHHGGDAAVRPDGRRQRIELVLPGHPQPGLRPVATLNQLKGIPGTAFEVVDTGTSRVVTATLVRRSERAGISDLSFTHLDPLGRARMVDVTPKEATHRRAVARCKVMMKPETTLAIANREVKKGDVLSVARVAGIQAAKRLHTDMIPLCHPLLVGACRSTSTSATTMSPSRPRSTPSIAPGSRWRRCNCATAALTITTCASRPIGA